MTKTFASEEERQENEKYWQKLIDTVGCAIVTFDEVKFTRGTIEESGFANSCIAYMEDITLGEFLSQCIDLETKDWETGIYPSQLISFHEALPFHTRVFNLLLAADKPVKILPKWKNND